MSGPGPRPNKIIFTHGGGRFANQLMTFGHLIAVAEEHPDIQVVDYAFWPYANLCAGTEHNPSCAYPPRRGTTLGARFMSLARRMTWRRRRAAMHNVVGLILNKLRPRRLIDYGPLPGDGSVVIQLGGEEFLNRVRSRKTALLMGWFLRDWALFEKHEEAVRRFLAPAERFTRVAEPFIADLRKRHDPLVGLLIRQDDYRYWAGGKYFFPTEQYRTFVRQLRQRFGRRAGILIATDEVQPAGAYDEFGVTFCTGEKAGPGHYQESFAELSMCDVVASVPSTFAAWAAFFGKKPILPISAADDNLTEVAPLARHLLDARRHPAFKDAVN
jgi:hypothetical protein